MSDSMEEFQGYAVHTSIDVNGKEKRRYHAWIAPAQSNSLRIIVILGF